MLGSQIKLWNTNRTLSLLSGWRADRPVAATGLSGLHPDSSCASRHLKAEVRHWRGAVMYKYHVIRSFMSNFLTCSLFDNELITVIKDRKKVVNKTRFSSKEHTYTQILVIVDVPSNPVTNPLKVAHPPHWLMGLSPAVCLFVCVCF